MAQLFDGILAAFSGKTAPEDKTEISKKGEAKSGSSLFDDLLKNASNNATEEKTATQKQTTTSQTSTEKSALQPAQESQNSSIKQNNEESTKSVKSDISGKNLKENSQETNEVSKKSPDLQKEQTTDIKKSSDESTKETSAKATNSLNKMIIESSIIKQGGDKEAKTKTTDTKVTVKNDQVETLTQKKDNLQKEGTVNQEIKNDKG